MNTLERWFLRRIIRKEVKQGSHRERIADLYSMIHEACENEFTEDNKPTLNAFLKECNESRKELNL